MRLDVSVPEVPWSLTRPEGHFSSFSSELALQQAYLHSSVPHYSKFLRPMDVLIKAFLRFVKPLIVSVFPATC